MTSTPFSRRRPRAAARPSPGRRSHPLRALARAVSWHRRPLAAVAAALAVLTGLTAALPEPPPEQTVLDLTKRPDLGGMPGEVEAAVRVLLPLCDENRLQELAREQRMVRTLNRLRTAIR